MFHLYGYEVAKEGDFPWKILQKKHDSLNQRLDFKDCKPNSRKNFSEDVLLIAPVIAMAALYWTDSRFLWNNLLNTRS